MMRHELAVMICSENECSHNSAVRLFQSESERFEFFNVVWRRVLLLCRREFLDLCEDLFVSLPSEVFAILLFRYAKVPAIEEHHGYR